LASGGVAVAVAPTMTLVKLELVGEGDMIAVAGVLAR
jgi:hypothetical protein